MSSLLNLLVLQFMTLQKKKRKMAPMDINVKSFLLKRNEWPIVLEGRFCFFTYIMRFYNFLNILVLFQSILEDDKLLLKWGCTYKSNGMCFLLSSSLQTS